MNRLNDITAVHRHQHSSPDLLILARGLWAGRWLIAGAVVFALLLAAAYVATLEPRYRAVAVLLLEGPERKVVDFEEPVDTRLTEEKKLDTEARLLTSRGLVARLVEELSLSSDPEFNPTLQPLDYLSIGWGLQRLREFAGSAPPPEPDAQTVRTVTIDSVLGSIEVFGVPNTYLLELHVETSSPEKSAEIANTLARLYISTQAKSRFETKDKAIDWLDRQVKELKDELRSAEERLKAFTASAEVMSSEALLQYNVQLKGLRERHARSLDLVRRAEQRVAILEDVLSGIAPDGTAIAEKDPELAAILRPSPGANGSALDRSELVRLLNRTNSDLKREKQQAATTREAVADLEKRIGRQSAEMVQLQQIEREVQANAAIYEFALARLKQLSVERGIQFSGARIQSEADPPLSPSGPGAATVSALAVAVGCMFGFGIILVQQRLQDTFRTPEEIERLSGIAVLGQIPRLHTRRRRKVLKEIMADRPSPFSEAVRSLRASILSISQTPRIVIVLSSAMPGEGKTTLAMALAQSLSAIGKKVLLIDADMRIRALSRMFPGIRQSDGLSAAIYEDMSLSELAVHSDALDADIVFSDLTSYNAADIFSSTKFRQVITSARKSYHVTIIDTPPALLVSDAKLIGQHADMLLLVVKWNKTSKWQFLDAVRELEMGNCGVRGCILSQIDPKGLKKYGYGDRRGALAGHRAGYYR